MLKIIQDVNDMISWPSAGKTAGSIFEGEKAFDLVVRLSKARRKILITYNCL